MSIIKDVLQKPWINNPIVSCNSKGNVTHFKSDLTEYIKNSKGQKTYLVEYNPRNYRKTENDIKYDINGRVSYRRVLIRLQNLDPEFEGEYLLDDEEETRTKYNKAGQIIKRYTSKGEIMEFKYDRKGNCIYSMHQINDTTLEARSKYDRKSNMIEKKTSEGLVETWTYNKHGDVETYHNSDGEFTEIKYDKKTKEWEKRDQNGLVEYKRFNSKGDCVENIKNGYSLYREGDIVLEILEDGTHIINGVILLTEPENDG